MLYELSIILSQNFRAHLKWRERDAYILVVDVSM